MLQPALCRPGQQSASLESSVEEIFPLLQHAKQECSRLRDEAAHQQHLQSDLQQQVEDLQAQQSSLRASMQNAEQTAAASQRELGALKSQLQQESAAREQLQVSRPSSIVTLEDANGRIVLAEVHGLSLCHPAKVDFRLLAVAHPDKDHCPRCLWLAKCLTLLLKP